MNVLDVKLPEEIAELDQDKLEWLFERQAELREEYRKIEAEKDLMKPLKPGEEGNLNSALVQAHLKDFAWRIVEELGEAMNCLRNKPWKQTEVLVDKDHFFEELGDAVHFLIELCIIAGMDAEDFFAIYYKKSEVNKFRQRTQY